MLISTELTLGGRGCKKFKNIMAGWPENEKIALTKFFANRLGNYLYSKVLLSNPFKLSSI